MVKRLVLGIRCSRRGPSSLCCGRHRRGCCAFRSCYRQACRLLQPCCCRCASPVSLPLCPLVRSWLLIGWPDIEESSLSFARATAHLMGGLRRPCTIPGLRLAAVADHLGERLPDRSSRACTAQRCPAAAAGRPRGTARAEVFCCLMRLVLVHVLQGISPTYCVMMSVTVCRVSNTDTVTCGLAAVLLGACAMPTTDEQPASEPANPAVLDAIAARVGMGAFFASIAALRASPAFLAAAAAQALPRPLTRESAAAATAHSDEGSEDDSDGAGLACSVLAWIADVRGKLHQAALLCVCLQVIGRNPSTPMAVILWIKDLQHGCQPLTLGCAAWSPLAAWASLPVQ